MDLFRKLGRIPEEGPSFRVETSCSIKRLLEDEELCCWRNLLLNLVSIHYARRGDGVVETLLATSKFDCLQKFLYVVKR